MDYWGYASSLNTMSIGYREKTLFKQWRDIYLAFATGLLLASVAGLLPSPQLEAWFVTWPLSSLVSSSHKFTSPTTDDWFERWDIFVASSAN